MYSPETSRGIMLSLGDGTFERLRGNSAGAMLSSDFALEVSRGNVPGMSELNKFGRNPSISTATDPEDVWDGGGLWVPPTTARIHDVASDDAADIGVVQSSGTVTGSGLNTLVDTAADFVSDGVAADDIVIDDTTFEHSIVVSVDSATQLTLEDPRHGAAFGIGDAYRVVRATSTGLAVLHIKGGLDINFNAIQEFIVMNGTTNVPTVQAYTRINRMHTDGAAGRTVTNVGTITATAQVDATVTAQMNPGNGTTMMAHYTVPAGKTLYLYQWHVGILRSGVGSGAMADFSLRESPFALHGHAGQRFVDNLGAGLTGNSGQPRVFNPPRPILQRSDIWVRCDTVTDNNTIAYAGFDGVLADDSVVD